MAVAMAPTMNIDTLITHIISFSEADCLNMSLYTFLANMEEAESTDESAEDMTAAETAPSPKNEMKLGVKNCRTIGRIILASSDGIGIVPS